MFDRAARSRDHGGSPGARRSRGAGARPSNVEAGVLYPEACHVSDPAHPGLGPAKACDRTRRATRAWARSGHSPRKRRHPPSPRWAMSTTRSLRQGRACRRHMVAQAREEFGRQIPLDTERGYNATYPLRLVRPQSPDHVRGRGLRDVTSRDRRQGRRRRRIRRYRRPAQS